MFGYAALLAAAFAPGLFWLWYFYRKDTLEPEPKRLILRMFFLGILLGIPATILELFPVDSIVMTVILAPAIEESLKFLGVRFTVYLRREFDEPMDGIIYTAAVALGFASMENWFYLWATYLNAHDAAQSFETLSPLGILLSVFIIRALLSVPSHVLYSSLWGYALGKAKFMDPARGRRLIVKGLALAMLCHGLFNYFAANLPEAALAEVVLVAVLWVIILRRMAESIKISPHRTL